MKERERGREHQERKIPPRWKRMEVYSLSLEFDLCLGHEEKIHGKVTQFGKETACNMYIVYFSYLPYFFP